MGTERLLLKLAKLVTDTDCDSDVLTLRRIQQSLVSVAGQDDDDFFIKCARCAFPRPDVLYEAFHVGNQDALVQVREWIIQAHTREAHGTLQNAVLAAIPDDLVIQATDSSEHSSQDLADNIVETICLPQETVNPCEAHEAADIVSTMLSVADPLRDVRVSHSASKLRRSLSRVADVEKCRSKIKRVMANNLRDSFF